MRAGGGWGRDGSSHQERGLGLSEGGADNKTFIFYRVAFKKVFAVALGLAPQHFLEQLQRVSLSSTIGTSLYDLLAFRQ